MPSPFPGMDPFIERQVWQDFHGSIIFGIRDALVPRLRPKYILRSEERIYLEQEADPGLFDLPFISADPDLLDRVERDADYRARLIRDLGSEARARARRR